MPRRILEFRDMSEAELVQRLSESKEEIFNLRFQAATGQLENNARIRTLRKDVARINMLLRDREIAAAEALAQSTMAGKN